MKFPVTIKLMSPKQGATQAVWLVIDPDGYSYSTPGTATQGLQEAIDLADTADVNIACDAAGTGAVFTCLEGIYFPPVRHRRIDLGTTTLNIVPPNPATPGIRIDSTMMATMHHYGQVVYWGNGPALLFDPTNPMMPENEIACACSDFRFQAVACMVENGFGVRFAGAGPIQDCTFKWLEINGKNDASGVRSYHGIEVISPQGFVGNDVLAQNIHGFKGIGVRAGVAPTSAIYGNRWRALVAPGAGAPSLGMQTFASNDDISLMVIRNEMASGGLVDYGLKIEAGCRGLDVSMPRCDTPIGQKILDLSPGNAGHRKWDA